MRLAIAPPPAFPTSPLRARSARRARRPGHEVSTAHLQAAYPFLAEGGLGGRGVYIGRDAYGQAVAWDPFELYEMEMISSPNVFIAGQISTRKSAFVKTFLYRSALFGRYAWVVDVKGEYGRLCRALGGTHLHLRPGGDIKLNPISRLASAEEQDALLQAVAAAALSRDLRPEEATGLTAALDVVRDKHREPILPHVVEVLLRPETSMAERLVTSVEELARDVRTVALALMRLCEGELRGMFDGPTTKSIDWNARIIVIDLSEVADSKAVAVLMACATAEIQAQVKNRHRRAEMAQEVTPKTNGTVDEGWRIYREIKLAEWMQQKLKLCRRWGESNWNVVHRVSDLAATGAAGSRESALAEGVLAETEIRRIYKQAPDQMRLTRERLGLSATQAAIVPTLAPGIALEIIGSRSAIVQHRVSRTELTLIETDEHMHLRKAA